MQKRMKSKRQMQQSFRAVAQEAAKTNQGIKDALSWVDMCYYDQCNTFGTANGTVRDYLNLFARPSDKMKMKSLSFEMLWFVFVNLLQGRDSSDVKNVFVPVLARSLAHAIKSRGRNSDPLADSDLVQLISITNKARTDGLFAGEALHAVNYMMKRAVKACFNEKRKIAQRNDGVIASLRKRGVEVIL